MPPSISSSPMPSNSRRISSSCFISSLMTSFFSPSCLGCSVLVGSVGFCSLASATSTRFAGFFAVAFFRVAGFFGSAASRISCAVNGWLSATASSLPTISAALRASSSLRNIQPPLSRSFQPRAGAKRPSPVRSLANSLTARSWSAVKSWSKVRRETSLVLPFLLV